MNLSGKTVFITGAARGIGAEVARLAAAQGATVAVAGLEPAKLSALAGEIGGLWFDCDVTDSAGLERAVAATVTATGRIDVVLANAGIANIGTVAISPVDALVRTLDVNLAGVFRTVHATLPHLRESRGHFLLVSSVAAFTALPGMAAYAASKAGVEQLGNVLRLETAHLGITVGTAHPIWIDTDMVRDFEADLPSFRAAKQRMPWPLGTTVTVQKCARLLVRGIEKRKRKVYVPGSIAVVQALRTVVLSAFADAVIRSGGRDLVPRMEAEVRALGRDFGAHAVGTARPEATP
ncbi:NAD(P)-dependent dehydrogenase (short-subunit alcohol dehydrogenase family) [Allocatelliglobosispora scoriae]|uniref:NAD(P)-dependent dehydrogenase (Short-subunit alcohol dehydrogenase family) n=1 Tax=Allocatelliglobosispora scoriae TaxID=643052 RepID=A0A841C202_9ACTN|nr:SDR family oxidoreductase [Allocatelliglobosispora scoriae]MBB5873000.1 NAD(P)-dependent dehydrogenase (short-subunit alcohol dehydrogenase family) [Allocatelliglobosispora scoriae]